MFLIKCPPISFPFSFCKTADSYLENRFLLCIHLPLMWWQHLFTVSVYFFIFPFFFFFYIKKIDQMYFSLSFLGRMLMSLIVLKCLYCGNVEWPLFYQVTIQQKQKVYRLKYHYYLFPAINSNSWEETISKKHLESKNKFLLQLC